MELLKLAEKRLRYSSNGKLYWVDAGRRGDLVGKEAGVVSKTDGYRYVKIMQKRIPAHRIVFFMHHGYAPAEIDHKNRIRDDNRIENLREASRLENSRNISTQSKLKSSKYKGVVFDKARGKWMASTKNKGRSVYLGRFDSEVEAAIAYNQYAAKEFGEFAAVNEVDYE